LELDNNRLVGPIPAAWAPLAPLDAPPRWPVPSPTKARVLQMLHIASNALTGTLPPWLPAAFPGLEVGLGGGQPQKGVFRPPLRVILLLLLRFFA
jgi:hypothetical protein